MQEILATKHYRLVRTRHGLLLANPNDVYIGRALVTYGEYSEFEVGLLMRLLGEGMVAIEAGANIGAITVPLARRVGTGGLIHAFEPQPLVFQQLCAGLALNDLVNVSAMNAATGDAPDRLEVARLNPGSEQNFGGTTLERLKLDGSGFACPVVRLDDAVDPRRLDLIKADVEGMELETLRGAAGLIDRFRPVLYLECQRDRAPALIAHVLDLGYDCWWHAPPLFNPENFAGNRENIYPRLVSYNMLCVPSERKADVRGLPRVAGPQDHPSHRGTR